MLPTQAPVLTSLDVLPRYHELDVAPTGAMWGSVSNNSRGNASNCASCNATGKLPCEGLATFPGTGGLTARVTNASHANRSWTEELGLPWTIVDAGYRPQPRAGARPHASTAAAKPTEDRRAMA